MEQGGTSSGFLVAALNRYRPLNEKSRGFVTLVAAHIAAGIGSASSYRAQQRRAEELAELDRAKTTFFSNISHEFRTPLTLILDPVAELRGREQRAGRPDSRRNWTSSGATDYVSPSWSTRCWTSPASRPAARRPATSRWTSRPSPPSWPASSGRPSTGPGWSSPSTVPPMDEPVYIDRDMWEKVILNLLSNALKFTFDGSISVAVRRAGDEAVVTVADTGIGVPASGDASAVRAVSPHRDAHTRDPTRAAGSGWHWSRSWSACTAAASTPTAPKAWAPPSRFVCRSAPRICPPTPSRRRAAPWRPRASPNRTCRKRCAGCPPTLSPPPLRPPSRR